jgi:hypothetical protein
MTPVARGNESGYLQTLYFPKTHSPLAPAAEQSPIRHTISVTGKQSVSRAFLQPRGISPLKFRRREFVHSISLADSRTLFADRPAGAR